MVFLQDDRFFLVLYFVCMLLSWKEDLCINVCSWIFNSVNMGGENQLRTPVCCFGCVQPSCWELAWFYRARNAEWDWCALCRQRGHRTHLFCTPEQSPRCVEEGILIFCPRPVCFAREVESRAAQSSGVVSVLQRLLCSSVRRGRSGSRNAREAFLMRPQRRSWALNQLLCSLSGEWKQMYHSTVPALCAGGPRDVSRNGAQKGGSQEHSNPGLWSLTGVLLAKSGSETLPGSRALTSLALLHVVTRGIGEFKPEGKSNISPSDLRKIWFGLVLDRRNSLAEGRFVCLWNSCSVGVSGASANTSYICELLRAAQ